MDSAGQDPQRLVDLIQNIGTTPPEARARLRDHLKAFASQVQDKDQRLAVWSAVREETNKHRHFHQAQWALPETEIAPFDSITSALAPEDLIDRYAWLFQDHYPMLALPDPNLSATDAALEAERTKAVQEIIADRGVDGIRSLASAVKFPVLVGVSAAAINADEPAMLTMITSEDDNERICGMGYANERYRSEGMQWIDHTLAKHHDWNANTRAALLLAIPSEKLTWERAEQHKVIPEFWKRTRPILGSDAASDDVVYAVGHLLGAGQVSQAFERASMNARKLPTAMIGQTLDALLQVLQNQREPVDHLVSYYLVQLLNALDERQDIDLGTMARYEWAFLPLLRGERNLRLHEHLARAPDLFTQIIMSIYRPPSGQAQPEPTKQNIARARQAYDLLTSWRTIPGTQADGSIDREQLFAWVEAAREQCVGLLDACDDQIGKVLAGAPPGADGIWPHESIRAIIEHLSSKVIEDGFRAGAFNRRGVVARDPFAGGVQERALAGQYRAWAAALAAGNPKTSAALAEIAESYVSFRQACVTAANPPC